jgi:hypothetical protein
VDLGVLATAEFFHSLVLLSMTRLTNGWQEGVQAGLASRLVGWFTGKFGRGWLAGLAGRLAGWFGRQRDWQAERLASRFGKQVGKQFGRWFW